MQKTKDDIKSWLKKIGKDRFWLAEKCLVSKRGIDNWFKKDGKIPESKLTLVQSLMGKEPVTEHHHKSAREEVTLSFVAEEWELIKWCSNHMNISVERWIEECVLASSDSLRKHGVDQYYPKNPLRKSASLPPSGSQTA